MSFTVGSIDQKQHINLSISAWDTINEDISYFILSKGLKYNLSGFLNKIFLNFYEDAKASIRYRINDKRDEVSEVLKYSYSKITNNDLAEFINKYVKSYQYSILSEIENYEKGKGIKFRVNNEMYDVLDDSEDDRYYFDNLGLYLKGIFEEYTMLPFSRREKVYYKDVIDEFQEAVFRKKMLKITLENNRTFLISPFNILASKSTSYNYLIAKTFIEVTEAKEIEINSISSFRISRIKKIRMMKSRNSKLLKKDELSIKKRINDYGVQFLTLNRELIKIKLTPKGKKNYNSQLYLRPKLKEISGDIYSFECSTLQIIYYFYKFGKDAEVIYPKELRETFKVSYEKALEVYK